MASKVQLRRDTAANWTSNNPTLAAGEQALETNTGLVKVGDGTTAFTSLPYQLLNTYYLAASTGAIGSAIADYFPSAAVTLAAGGLYEVEYELYFTKTTNGTVTFTLTSSQAPVNLNAYYIGTPAGGVGTQAGQIGAAITNSTATGAALPATVSLNTGTNHHYIIKAIVEVNATNNSTFKLQATEGAGTITPLRGSSYTVRRLPGSNIGAFA